MKKSGLNFKSSLVILVLALFVASACGGRGGNKDYVGTWEANNGTLKLIFTETTFELWNSTNGELMPSSKGTISVKNDKMEQTVTHIYDPWGGEAADDKPGWYDHDQHIEKAVRNGFKKENAEKMMKPLFKTYTSSFSVSDDKNTLSYAASKYTRVE